MTVARPNASGNPTMELSGAHKVTALLLSMVKPLADRIIKQFEDREIRALARSASELPALGIGTIEQLVSELVRQVESAGTIEGSSSGARELLTGIVPEDVVGEIMGELAGQAPTLIWKQLGTIAEEKLASFLSTEEPQVAAYVISKLDTQKASAVMSRLAPELRADLCVRLISLKPVGDAAARLLAERLGNELVGSVAPLGKQNNHALLGAILNRLERDKTATILERLDTDRPGDAHEVRKFVFGFEDLARLTPEDRARLLDETPVERTVLALRECEPGLAATVLSSLAPRARRLVDSELAIVVNVPQRAIDDARRAIADLALALAERTVISLPGGEQA